MTREGWYVEKRRRIEAEAQSKQRAFLGGRWIVLGLMMSV